MYEPSARDGVLQLWAPGTRWLSTGLDGGFCRADAAYNLTVPEGFDRTDLARYVDERLERAGFEGTGPALLTGVDLEHARAARSGDVVAVVTAGLSNPAALPVPQPAGEVAGVTEDRPAPRHDGTVNLLVGTTRSVDDGALATLVTVAAEAKAATLLALTGVPGTTTDAVVAGCDPGGDPAPFAGSGTDVGADARACVRDALAAALRSRHPGVDLGGVVADAEHGVRTDRKATVFEI